MHDRAAFYVRNNPAGEYLSPLYFAVRLFWNICDSIRIYGLSADAHVSQRPGFSYAPNNNSTPAASNLYGPQIALDAERMIRHFLFTTLVFSMMAHAETISLSPISDGRGTIGELSGFMVVDGSITIGGSGNVDILLNFNYATPGAGGPSTDLGTYSDFGITLDVADLVFQVGSDNYGIPILSHSGAPNGGTASQFASVLAGHFYQATNLLTAQTVLNNPGLIYRNNADVWLGNSVTDLGTLTETITSHGSSTPKYTVEFTGQLPASFLTDANTNGFEVGFGSAICGNGYLVGSAAPVPEPASVVLMASVLLALTACHFIKGRRSRMRCGTDRSS